jgi:hypothetical protein
MPTPAQAYGHPDFVTDVPVQGPTDEGIRSKDCLYVNTHIPAQPACADCKGPIPMWAQQNTPHGVGELISYGGHGALGFALGTVNDPEIWSKLTPDQQMWVTNSLNTLNSKIMAATGSSCPTWGPAINLAGGCFQTWFNNNYGGANSGVMTLRTDGVFDQDTLCALITVTGMHQTDFPTAFPDPNKQYCQSPGSATATKKILTAKMLGFGALGVVGLGGIAYAAIHGKKRRR